MSWLDSSKNKEANQTLKTDYKYQNENWTLIQSYNDKENEKKQELVDRPHLLPLVFYLGNKGKDSP